MVFIVVMFLSFKKKFTIFTIQIQIFTHPSYGVCLSQCGEMALTNPAVHARQPFACSATHYYISKWIFEDFESL